ncbi:hypothetical protein Taro_054049, partial [Colocasia esculenta]|nr:hypothetical protein [Colocasia esculenta]
VASIPVGSECELQESVVVVAGCTCYERGFWFARTAVGFVVGLCVCVGVSRRLREPTCGVAFTGAGLWSMEPSASLLELRRCFVCRVAPLVERYDTCLWLLSALCWLVVSSGEVLSEFFFVGSGGSERPVACLLPLLFVGCSGWWCSAMAFGVVFSTVATFVVKFANVLGCLAFPTSNVIPDSCLCVCACGVFV